MSCSQHAPLASTQHLAHASDTQWKVAPALAAGNCCILKPSEAASVTCLELAQLALEAGLPPGVLNVLTGLGADVGAPLSSHPAVAKVGCILWVVVFALTGGIMAGWNIARTTLPCLGVASLPPGVLSVLTGLGADVGAPLSSHPAVAKVGCIPWAGLLGLVEQYRLYQHMASCLTRSMWQSLTAQCYFGILPERYWGVFAPFDHWREQVLFAPVLATLLAVGAQQDRFLLAFMRPYMQIAFTGSTATGRAVSLAAAKNLRPATAELGGKSALIIFEDADLDKAVEWVMFGAFWTNGACTC